MSQETLAEAYARLNALKSNLPTGLEVDQKYVQEFHSILDLLRQVSGRDLSKFRIQMSEIYPEVSGGNYLTGEVDYSGRHVCERSFLMMKVDGVLGFFSIQSAAQKPIIGFRPTEQ